MKTLLKKYLLKVIKEYALEAFTWENLKLARNRLYALIEAAIEQSETKMDDWAWSVVKGILNDENLKKIYDWILNNALNISPQTEMVYGIHYRRYEELARTLTLDTDGKTYAAPSLTALLNLLEIIMPLLLEWYRGKSGNENGAQNQ